MNANSATVLGLLLLILAASLAVFSVITRGAASRGRMLAIGQWARVHGGKILDSHELNQIPRRLAMLVAYRPRFRLALEGSNWTMAEFTTTAPAEAKGKIPRWRLVTVDLGEGSRSWPATGLRPAARTVSLTDLLQLSSFPSLSGGDHFIIFGVEPEAAAALAESTVHERLPADIGLLLMDKELVLDFSNRRFETDELPRMLELARNLAASFAPQAEAKA